MILVFFLEYFVFDPILIAIFKNRDFLKFRGGYYYDIPLG